MREVITTSILWGCDQKNHFFEGVEGWGEGGLGSGPIIWDWHEVPTWKFLPCGKRAKTKSQKVLQANNSYVCISYRGSTGRGAFLCPVHNLLMAFQEFSKNYLNILMVQLFQHLLYFHNQEFFLWFLLYI